MNAAEKPILGVDSAGNVTLGCDRCVSVAVFTPNKGSLNALFVLGWRRVKFRKLRPRDERDVRPHGEVLCPDCYSRQVPGAMKWPYSGKCNLCDGERMEDSSFCGLCKDARVSEFDPLIRCKHVGPNAAGAEYQCVMRTGHSGAHYWGSLYWVDSESSKAVSSV
jgi:hypothetical protein